MLSLNLDTDLQKLPAVFVCFHNCKTCNNSKLNKSILISPSWNISCLVIGWSEPTLHCVNDKIDKGIYPTPK